MSRPKRGGQFIFDEATEDYILDLWSGKTAYGSMTLVEISDILVKEGRVNRTLGKSTIYAIAIRAEKRQKIKAALLDQGQDGPK